MGNGMRSSSWRTFFLIETRWTYKGIARSDLEIVRQSPGSPTLFYAVALDGSPVDAEAETRLVVQVQVAALQFRAVGVEAGPQRVALGIRERLDTEPIGDRGDQVAVDVRIVV